jgi:hypothetical protein
MYYSYIEIEYVATSFSPARTDLAVKLLSPSGTDFKRLIVCRPHSNDGVETINLLIDKRSAWLRKR